jgi:hypothetical protein
MLTQEKITAKMEKVNGNNKFLGSNKFWGSVPCFYPWRQSLLNGCN